MTVVSSACSVGEEKVTRATQASRNSTNSKPPHRVDAAKKKERNRQLMMQHKKKKRPRDAQDEANGQGQRTRALRQPKAKAKREEQSWCVLFHPFAAFI